MTTVAEVLTWPKGAEVRDLYVRVTGAWEYKEFDGQDGEKWGYLPLSVKDDSSQEYLRVEWRKPKTKDPAAIKGKRIVLSAYNGKGCSVDVYQDKHRVKVSGGCLRSDDGSGVADPTATPSQGTIGPQTATQGAGKPTLTELQSVMIRVIEETATDLGFVDPIAFPPEVLAALIARCGGLGIGLGDGNYVNDWKSEPEVEPTPAPDDGPPPPDDDEIPF